jgi:coatomer protein complex subunit alpha (xenin)
LLNNQIGVVNFAPLKPYFMQLFIGSRAAIPTMASVPSLASPLQRNDSVRGGLPALCISLPPLIEELKSAYRSTTAGKFTDALNIFQGIMCALPFLVADTKKEINEVRHFLCYSNDIRSGNCWEFVEITSLD